MRPCVILSKSFMVIAAISLASLYFDATAHSEDSADLSAKLSFQPVSTKQDKRRQEILRSIYDNLDQYNPDEIEAVKKRVGVRKEVVNGRREYSWNNKSFESLDLIELMSMADQISSFEDKVLREQQNAGQKNWEELQDMLEARRLAEINNRRKQ